MSEGGIKEKKYTYSIDFDFYKKNLAPVRESFFPDFG